MPYKQSHKQAGGLQKVIRKAWAADWHKRGQDKAVRNEKREKPGCFRGNPNPKAQVEENGCVEEMYKEQQY